MIDIQLFQGDCLDGLKDLAAGSIDLTVTSPPYDNLRTYNGFPFDFEGIAREMYRVTKPGGVVVWVVGDATIKGSETGTSFRQALYFRDVCGFNLHDTMIWNKGAFSAVGALATRYAPVFEYMFVFSKGKIKTFNPIKDKPNKCADRTVTGTIRQKDGSVKPMTMDGKRIAEMGQRFNVWDKPAVKVKQSHPAPFPEWLAADHIVSWSNPGDTVLDPFLGSGTTGKMAVLAGRRFIGMEVSLEYISIAKERIEEANK
jgi:DNA modification methylase